MFGHHHCLRCDVQLPYEGMCEKCNKATAELEVLAGLRPAPKEEEMYTATCIGCNREQPIGSMLGPYCHTCEHMERLKKTPAESPHSTTHTAERRALARDAYMAALGGLCSNVKYLSPIDIHKDSQHIALEAARRWDAFMAAVDAEGGE